jgi:GTPase SAR1 family protein
MAKFLKKKEKKDHTVSTFKVALLGSKDVGKTAFMLQLLQETFETEYNPSQDLEVTLWVSIVIHFLLNGTEQNRIRSPSLHNCNSHFI